MEQPVEIALPVMRDQKDVLAGRQRVIHAERDRKLAAEREHRKNRRQRAA